MGDFNSVSEAIQSLLDQVAPKPRLFKPRILIHLMPEAEGGYTQVEMRAFKEAAEQAGGIANYLSVVDRPLTDSEIRSGMQG